MTVVKDKKNVAFFVKLIVLALAFVFLASALGLATGYYFSEKSVTIEVRRFSIKAYGGTDRYLIFTEQGVYQNVDDPISWKFDSSDLQNELRANHTYRVSVRGWRVPALDWYPNILDVEKDLGMTSPPPQQP